MERVTKTTQTDSLGDTKTTQTDSPGDTVQPNQAGYITLGFGGNQVVMASFGNLVLGQLNIYGRDCDLAFEEVFHFTSYEFDKFFGLLMNLARALTGEKIDISSFLCGEFNITGQALGGAIQITKEKDQKVIGMMKIKAEYLPELYKQLHMSVPIMLSTDTTQAECFSYFLSAVEKMSKTFSLKESQQRHAHVTKVLKNSLQLTCPTNDIMWKKIIEEMHVSMPIKSEYQGFLLQQFVHAHVKYFFMYYYLWSMCS